MNGFQICGEKVKFQLKKSLKMGFFAGPFCGKLAKNADHRVHLLTRPNWATHMDLPTSALSERDVLEDYITFRKQVKKGSTS